MALLIDQIDEDEDQLPDSAATPDRDATTGRDWSRAIRIVLIAAMTMAVAFALRGSGAKQWVQHKLGWAEKLAPPLFVGGRPADGSANVKPDEVITLRLTAPNGAFDEATLTPQNITLRRADDALPVLASLSQQVASNGGVTITVQPQRPLDGMTNYTITIGNGLKDAAGVSAVEKTIKFSTGSMADPSIAFQQVSLPGTHGVGYTCVQMGPDGHLWAGADDGRIFRFPIQADGTLGKPELFETLQKASGGPRLLTGFAFDPASQSDNVVLWASHGWFGFADAPDLSGKVSRLSGPKLESVHDVVVGLPRSIRDHLTNQPAFGPDGALYIPQPSNSAFGAPDADWGNRPERKLSASILRLNVAALKEGQTIDVRTADVGGTYDPDAADAPLKIYATGIRLAYNLLWHSNGRLYAAVNGSSPGGNTPAGPNAPALTNIPTSEHDWFFDIRQGRYYGHPNPAQGHYVLNGGNPTAGIDPGEVTEYPVGTKPDSRWTAAAYDFGNHVSPNGTIEYRSSYFGGKLTGKVLVCRYNGGSDVICLDLDKEGNVRTAYVGIPGTTHLANPLDLTEDPKTGCVYVSEYGGQKLTLLRPR